MSLTQLYLLRHGEVESRYHRVFGGRIDMNLSPQGELQAAALADYLKNKPMDAIYCSPMKRAQQTLAPLLKSHPHIEPKILPNLSEVHFGDWTGLTWQEVHDKYQVSAFQWLEMLEQATLPNGECSRTFRERIEPCLQTILAEQVEKNVAIVCHGGVIRMILSILLKLPLPKMASFEIEYASVTQIHFTPDKIDVQLLNFTPWRDLP
ncbi:MAG: histidine phosphatase family protein [Verrucomicrobiota bacterium]